VAKIQSRLARIEDAEQIAELLRRSIVELCVADHRNRKEVLDAWLENKTAANVGEWIRNPANIMILATIEGQIAGVGCLRRDGHVILNYVAPRFRFRGVSKSLITILERSALELGVGSLRLESTKTAHRFYGAAGFSDAGPAETKHGMPTYPMTKQLSQGASAN